jgi:hypothetical protein
MRRGLYFLLGLTSVYLLLVAPAFGACIHRQHHLIAQGPSPSGKRWTVTAMIHNNGSCEAWLLGIDVRPSGTPRGSSSWGWSIQAGGHLSNGFTISARDENDGSVRTFYGAAGERVRTIVLMMSNGENLTIHPKLPRMQFRKRFVWLRNMRYFVRYYPPGHHVRAATLLNSRGEVIEKRGGEEGSFDANNGYWLGNA